jgi:hypothetical protein
MESHGSCQLRIQTANPLKFKGIEFPSHRIEVLIIPNWAISALGENSTCNGISNPERNENDAATKSHGTLVAPPTEQESKSQRPRP